MKKLLISQFNIGLFDGADGAAAAGAGTGGEVVYGKQPENQDVKEPVAEVHEPTPEELRAKYDEFMSDENNRKFYQEDTQKVINRRFRELLQQIADKGIKIAYVTLHVGLGTFRPVKEENVLEHHMHSEYYQVTEEAANTINETKRNGGRVICVGTTSCRTVESAADEQGMVQPGCDNTEIFIYPGYRFKVLDALITNFHLPESTLVMLVSALAGREHILHAYEEAIHEKYRFFSFGDAMFIADLKGEK